MPEDETQPVDSRPVTVTVDQLKVLSEPSRLRMLTLLMERDMSISGIAKALELSPATVHHHINQLLAARLIEPTKTEVWMPRFDIESSLELADALAALGMPTAFDGAADFSGITTAEALQIAKVVHQANMTVDEKGTEAAAATVVIMRLSAARVEVRIDRPFLVVLRDVPTGAIVFLGRVADPSETRS